MSKHTPGPWALEEVVPGNWWVGVNHPDSGFTTHAEVRSGCGEADELGDMLANARLIAGAPDLLEALALAREYVARTEGIIPRDATGRNLVSPDLERIDAALRKARGE